MTEPDPRDLWPDAATLAAGDEDKVAPDYLNDDWPRARPFQEDGHLAAEDYWRKHPDE